MRYIFKFSFRRVYSGYGVLLRCVLSPRLDYPSPPTSSPFQAESDIANAPPNPSSLTLISSSTLHRSANPLTNNPPGISPSSPDLRHNPHPRRHHLSAPPSPPPRIPHPRSRGM